MTGAVRPTILCVCLLFMVTFANVNASNPVPTIKDVSHQPLWDSTQTDKLKRALLLNYDKYARPSQHYNVTTVTIDMTIRHIDLDDAKSLFTVHSWVKLFWTDQKMRWNASDFGGMTVLHLAEHEVWQPDIVLYNSATGSAIDHYGNTHCLVHEDGTVLWVPPSHFVAFCEVNLRDWPFDVQQCSLRLGSWTYDGNQVDLQLDDSELDLELLVPNSEWQLEGITKGRNVVHYSCCEEPYVDVTYNITISRRSPAYKCLVITPAIVIIFMTLLTFWLSPFSNEKILLNGCTLIIISIFMLYFTQRLPAMAMNTPLVVLFYSNCLYMVMFSMIIAVFVIQVARGRKTASLPWIVKTPLKKFGCLLCLQYMPPQMVVNGDELREHGVGSSTGGGAVITTFDEQNTADDHQMLAPSQTTSTKSAASVQHDWLLFATAIDRLCFVCYSFVFIILAIVYSI